MEGDWATGFNTNDRESEGFIFVPSGTELLLHHVWESSSPIPSELLPLLEDGRCVLFHNHRQLGFFYSIFHSLAPTESLSHFTKPGFSHYEESFGSRTVDPAMLHVFGGESGSTPSTETGFGDDRSTASLLRRCGNTQINGAELISENYRIGPFGFNQDPFPTFSSTQSSSPRQYIMDQPLQIDSPDSKIFPTPGTSMIPLSQPNPLCTWAPVFELEYNYAFMVENKSFHAFGYQTSRVAKHLAKVRDEADFPTRPYITLRQIEYLGTDEVLTIRVGLQIEGESLSKPYVVMSNVFAGVDQSLHYNTKMEGGVLTVTLDKYRRHFSLWDPKERFSIPFRNSSFDHIARRLRLTEATKKNSIEKILQYTTRIRFEITDQQGRCVVAVSNQNILILAHKKHLSRLSLGSKMGVHTKETLIPQPYAPVSPSLTYVDHDL